MDVKLPGDNEVLHNRSQQVLNDHSVSDFMFRGKKSGVGTLLIIANVAKFAYEQ